MMGGERERQSALVPGQRAEVNMQGHPSCRYTQDSSGAGVIVPPLSGSLEKKVRMPRREEAQSELEEVWA